MATPAQAEQQRQRPRLVIPPGSTEPAQALVAVPAAAARAAVTATIVTGLVAFLAAARERERRWLASELASAPPQDVARLLAEETRRGQEFAEASAARIAGEVGGIVAIPDGQLRQARMAAVLEREKRYARQRSEAMAARAFAALGRVELRASSPAGAYWKLDPTVVEHTPGCLFLGERFWPWVVLDRVHPPRHAGCPCRLLGYHEAVLAGLLKAGDVPNVKDAVRSAAGVVMEAEVAEGIIAELELRDALAEAGLASPDALASIPLGVS